MVIYRYSNLKIAPPCYRYSNLKIAPPCQIKNGLYLDTLGPVLDCTINNYLLLSNFKNIGHNIMFLPCIRYYKHVYHAPYNLLVVETIVNFTFNLSVKFHPHPQERTVHMAIHVSRVCCCFFDVGGGICNCFVCLC